MGAIVVLGSQWGDEGKGKLVDIKCGTATLCCRAQGGNNAGHTIVHGDKKFDVHILPSGVVSPQCLNLIGSGCVIHPESFFVEIANVEKQGVNTKGRVFISDRCHVVLDLHQRVDGLEEVELGKESIGTTKKGIGPTYSTKMERSGVRMTDILNHEQLEGKMRKLAAGKKKRFGDLLTYDVEEELSRLKALSEKLRPYIVDQDTFLEEAEKEGKILVEGANAVMLDIDAGTYPFVTSSNTGIGGVITGLSLDPRSISEIIGVVKAYTTRVGGGPMPTEQLNENGEPNEIGKHLQSIGREFGVTTGRARRCGWLDLVVVKYSNRVNHYTSLNLTKLDILDGFPEIKIATSYTDPITKTSYPPSFPANLTVIDRMTVDYVTLPGWQCSTENAKTWEELPENARKYVEFIEEFVGVPVKYIGVGPGRESQIER